MRNRIARSSPTDFRGIAVIAVALLAAIPAAAERNRGEEAVKSFSRTIPMTRGTVSIDHSLGDIRIRTHSLPNVVVKANIEAAARREDVQQIANAIRIVAEPVAGGVSIRTEYPDMHAHGRSSVSVDYDITIPDSALLSVRSRFGDIDARGLMANGEFTNAHGSVELADSRGVQKIENSFGSIEISGLRGDAVAQNKNGSIDISGVTGRVNATSRFGSIEISNVSLNVVASSTNGSLEVSDTGPAMLTTSFGSASVDRVRGTLDLTSSYGKADIEQIAGNVTVKTSFGALRFSGITGNLTATGSGERISGSDVKGSVSLTNSDGAVQLREIAGRVTVTNANGPVTVSNAPGGVTVRNATGSVFVTGAGGPLDLVTTNGSVSISELRPEKTRCLPISVVTTFGSIHVGIPDQAGYDLNARTSSGKISSAVPMTNAVKQGEESLRGRIGPGGCPLVLANQSGSIVIEGE